MNPFTTEPPDERTSPPVINRVKPPSGLLPRHAQTWIIVGLAAVLIAILALTGQPATGRRGAATPAPPPPVDPNQVRIEEYRNRIDEQARRLAAEQAELAATKQALAEMGRPQSGSRAPAEEVSPGVPNADVADHETRQREARALFADLVAWSAPDRSPATRSDVSPFQAGLPPVQTPVAWPAVPPIALSAAAPLAGVPAPPTALPVQAPAAVIAAPSAPLGAPGAAATIPSAAPHGVPVVAPTAQPTALPGAPAAPPTTPSTTHPAAPLPSTPRPGTRRLLEGTLIEAVLTTRLDGGAAGPVTCLVTTPVYSTDFQHVLIPRGSRLLGTATPVTHVDQRRLVVAFHRLVFPSGHAVSLDRVPGLNQTGDVGLHDRVDHHTRSILAASLAVGALAGLTQINTRLGYDASWGDAYRQGVSGSLAQSSTRILDRFLNRLPTVTIREGHRVTVYLTADLDLPLPDAALSFGFGAGR